LFRLSERYFRPRAFELGGRIYEWLGVVPFKRALMSLVKRDPRKPTPNAYVLAGRSLDDVRTFERRSRRNEIFHLIGVLVALLLAALAAIARSWSISIAGVAILAANFHCFILQRYNRIRVYRLLDRARRGERPIS